MTHAPSKRSKRTQAWKRVRARARNPQTPAAFRVFIRRGMNEAFRDMRENVEKLKAAVRAIQFSGKLP
jgi:hypothetical protein